MNEKYNALIDAAVENLFLNNRALLSGVPIDTIKNDLYLAFSAVMPDNVPLSTVSPDYDSIILQLSTNLSQDKVWYDLLTAGTGQSLLRSIATGIAYEQFAIERAFQEGFTGTASADSSIYAAAEMLGARIARNIPGRVTVVFTRQDSDQLLEIPPYSTFTIEKFNFYNIDRIVFAPNILTADVVLYQGTLYQTVMYGTGLPYLEFEIGDGTNDLSDDNIQVVVGGKIWERSKGNPWQFDRGQRIYLDTTTPKGNMRIGFGNGEYGAVPLANEEIVITWSRTYAENISLAQSGYAVEYSGPSLPETPTGVTTTALTGAKNHLDSAFYARYAPHMYSGRERAVTRSNYKAVALEYPGVLDALFRGQAELGPDKRSAMNIVGATILTTTPFTSGEWLRFTEYMQNKGIFQCVFQRMDPTPVDLDIEALVFCQPSASLTNVKTELEKELNKMFAPRPDWLGYSVFLSDITDVLEGTGVLGGKVEYVQLLNPTQPLDLQDDRTRYIRLRSINLTVDYTTRKSPGYR